MMKLRGHLSLETFIREFEGTRYRREAIEATYSDIAGWCNYPITRRDEFDELGIGEDGEDLLRMRCSDLGVPNVFDSPYADRFPLLTVEDYVRFLSDMMERERNKQALSRAGAVNQAGTQQRTIQQQLDDAAFQEFMRQLQYPIQGQDLINRAMGLLPGGVSQAGSGSKSESNFSLGEAAGPIATAIF